MSDRTLFQRTFDGFRPANEKGQEFFGRVKLGEIVEIKATKVRNGQYHRLFFAILALISDNSEPHLTGEELLYFAKMATGTGKTIANPKTGQPEFIPGSISFAKMDQQAFEAFVQKAIPPLCRRFMNGTAPQAVIEEAMSLAA